MARYIWRDGRFVHHKTGEPLLTDEQRNGPVACPQVMSDIPDYASPITGEIIGSRSQRREDLKRHDCYEVDPPKKFELKNPRFAAKHGMMHAVNEETRETVRKMGKEWQPKKPLSQQL